MTKSKPDSSSEVYEVMVKYNNEKQFGYSNQKLQFFAEDMYLFFEGKGWAGITYWPALAMRWVLNNYNRDKPKMNTPPKKNTSTKIRDILLEQAGFDNEV